MPNVLQNDLAVVNLGPAAQVTIPHLLKDSGRGLLPTLIQPDRSTPIRVFAADATEVTFENPAAEAQTSNFLIQFDHTIQQARPPGIAPFEFWYQGDPGAGGGGGVGPIPFWAGGRETYAFAAPKLIVGAFEFQADRYTFMSATFRAVAARGDTVDAEVELFNVTDAASVATLTFVSTSQVLLQSADITGSLPAASKIYEVRINLAAAPGGSDSVELYKAELELVP